MESSKHTIDTEYELKEFINSNIRAVVVFGKNDCLHCSIVESVIESIEKDYPLIAFGFTTERDLAEKRHIEAYPVVAFYENGNIMGTLHGGSKIMNIKDMLNLWFKKD